MCVIWCCREAVISLNSETSLKGPHGACYPRRSRRFRNMAPLCPDHPHQGRKHEAHTTGNYGLLVGIAWNYDVLDTRWYVQSTHKPLGCNLCVTRVLRKVRNAAACVFTRRELATDEIAARACRLLEDQNPRLRQEVLRRLGRLMRESR